MRQPANKFRFILFLLALATALPLPLLQMNGLVIWASPLIFVAALLSRQSVGWFSLLGLAALIFIFMQPRAFCKWCCPVGLLNEWIAKKSRWRFGKQIPVFGKIAASLILAAAIVGVPMLLILDPLTIFYMFFDGFREQSWLVMLAKFLPLLLVVLSNIFLPHVWCGKLCPLGGLQDLAASTKKVFKTGGKNVQPLQPQRRVVISAFSGLTLGLLSRKFIFNKATAKIHPPAALPDALLAATCLRCGNCAKACPTHIIHSNTDVADVAALFTPVINFSESYCLPECNACGSVCPSGAIRHFSVRDKKKLFMATATIDVENCLLSQQKECDRCQFYCAYEAISIENSPHDFRSWPIVHTDRCVGCAACAIACPVSVISMHAIARANSEQA